MAVQNRQERGVGYKVFSSRLPAQEYERLCDYAWNKRLTLAAAIANLLTAAMEAEEEGGGEIR
ncbi:hypothetical protein FACS1894216_02150 [Synergistales bacterium]|nr:hypothetical protein FACS1894216_02150 [Synergistales bacterium]